MPKFHNLNATFWVIFKQCDDPNSIFFFHQRASITALKEGEDQKKKTYNALCTLPKNQKIEEVKAKLEGIKDLQLAQQTPIRVLHRRPDANRSRTVYFMEVKPLQRLFDQDNQKLFLLKLATQAGTYVKEFVHGDFGRTEPNLTQILGCDVDILALDVEVRKIFSMFPFLTSHCSKSSFFVQKFNFHFPWKLSNCFGWKLVKMLWFSTF